MGDDSPQLTPLSARSVPGSPRAGSIIRATVMTVSSYELHDDENKDDITANAKRRAQGMFDALKKSTAMFRQRLTAQSFYFIINVIVSVLIIWGCSCALLWEAYHHQRRYTTVGDGIGLSLCSFQTFHVYLTTAATYSVSDLMIGSFFSLWYAFRAVRTEKEALLVVFALCVIGVLGRAVYFSFVTAHYWVAHLSLETMQAFLCIGSFTLLVAVLQTWRVGRSFGWRMYGKGVASVADVERASRLKALDAASKLDLFLTINAFNTFFFFSPDKTFRYVGFGFTAVTAIFLLAIPLMVKRGKFFVSYLFAAVGLILPAFYIYLLVDIFNADPQQCYLDSVHRCNLDGNVTRVPQFLNFTSFPAVARNISSDNMTQQRSCLDCRNETTYDPDRLCWARIMQGNETQAQCLAAAQVVINACCSEFGRCELKEKLMGSNGPAAVFVVCCAILSRVATMIFGVQMARTLAAAAASNPSANEDDSSASGGKERSGSRSIFGGSSNAVSRNALSFNFLENGMEEGKEQLMTDRTMRSEASSRSPSIIQVVVPSGLPLAEAELLSQHGDGTAAT